MGTSFKSFIGAIIVILGGGLLICSHFMGWNDNNAIQFSAIGVMVLGMLVHIFINKKIQDKGE